MLDAALDAVMLLLAARFENRWICPWRLLLGALIGSGTAWITRTLAFSRGQTALLWLPTAYAMMLAAQGKRALAHPVRSICLLLCAAGLMGGTLTALSGAAGSLGIAYAAGGVCMAVMTASLIRARQAALDIKCVQIACSYRGRAVRFEAIIDSGNTLSFIGKYFAAKNAKSVRICTLLNKPSRREVEIDVDYIGFDVPDAFVVGYGLDYQEYYRNLPYIGVLKPEIYS